MSCLSVVDSNIKKFLRNKIANNLVDKANNPEPIDLNAYVKEIYNFFKEQGAGEDLALDAARIVPILLDQIVALKPEIAATLKKNSSRIRYDILELSEKFEENIEHVRDMLGLKEVPVEEIKLAQKQAEAAVAQEPVVEVPMDMANTIVSDYPEGAMMSYGVDVVTDPKASNYLEVLPHEVRNSNVKKTIDAELNKQIQDNNISDSSEMKLPGLDGGVFTRVMTDSSAQALDPNSFEEGHKPQYFGQGGLMIVITDKNGNPIKFDQTGKVDPNGKIAFYKMQDSVFRINGQIVNTQEQVKEYLAGPGAKFSPAQKNRFESMVKRFNDQINKLIEFNALGRTLTNEERVIARENAIKELTEQYDALESMRKYLYADSKNFIEGAINGLYGGFVIENPWQPTSLTAIDFSRGFNPISTKKETDANSTTKTGYVYLTFPGVEGHFIAHGDAIINKPEIVNTITSLFTEELFDEDGKALTPDARIRLIEQYINSSLTGVKIASKDAGGGLREFINSDGSYTVEITNDDGSKDKFKIKFDNTEVSKKIMTDAAAAIKTHLSTPYIKKDEFGFPIDKSLNRKDNFNKAVKEQGAVITTTLENAPPNSIYVKETIDAKDNKHVDRFRVYHRTLNANHSNMQENSYYHLTFETQADGKKVVVKEQRKYKDYIKENFITPVTATESKKVNYIGASIGVSPLTSELSKLSTPEAPAAQVESISKITETETVQPKFKVEGNDVVYTEDGSIAEEYSSPEEAQKNLQVWLDTQPSNNLEAEIAKLEAERYAEIDLLNDAPDGKSSLPRKILAKKANDIRAKYAEKIEALKKSAEPSVAAVEIKPADPIAPATEKGIADKSTEDLLKDVFNDPSFLQMNAQQKALHVKATEDQLKAAEAWYRNHPLAAHFPFRIMANAINYSAPGPAAQWATHGVILFHYYSADGKFDASKSGDFTDLYHEAWHGFTQTYLTEKQRTDLYNEARKQTGTFKDYKGNYVKFKDADWQQIEEYLAEDFRNYMTSGGVIKDKKATVKNSIFKNILEFFKKLFGKASTADVIQNPIGFDKIHELYEKMKVGDLSSFNYDINNRDKTIGVLNHALVLGDPNSTQKELSYQQSKLLVDTMDSLISTLINNEIKKSKIVNGATVRGNYSFTSQLMRNPAHVKRIYELVRRELQNDVLPKLQAKLLTATTELEKSNLEASIKLVETGLLNYGSTTDFKLNKDGKNLIYYHSKMSEHLEVDRDDLFDDLDEAEQVEFTAENFDKGGNEISQLDGASSEVQALLRSIHKYDADGKPVYNELGVHELTDYHEVFNRLNRVLLNTMERPDMYAKMLLAARSNTGEILDPLVDEVINKIGPSNTVTTAETNLWQKFSNTFNMATIPLDQMTIEKSGENDYEVKVGSVNTQSNKVGNIWRNAFRTVTSEYIRRDRDEDSDHFGSNYLDLQAVVNAFADPLNPNKLKSGASFDFLNAIGIRLSNKEVIKNAVNGPGGIGAAPYLFARLKNLAEQRDISRIYSLEEVFKAYPEIVKNGQPLQELKSENANFKALRELETKNSDYASNYMVTNAEGNTQFEQSLHNSISILISTINKVKDYAELMSLPYMQHLNIEKNPFAAASVWLKSIFDLDNYIAGDEFLRGAKKKENALDPTSPDVELTLSNLAGVQLIDENGDQGISSASADEFTKLILDFHLTNMPGGRPELMRHADKGTSFAVSLKKILGRSSYVETTDLIETTNKQGEVTRAADYTKVFEIVLPYVDAEIQRINKIKATAVKKNLKYDAKYLEDGSKFVIFEGVLSDKIQEKLLEAGSIANLDSTTKREVKNELKNYFEKQFTDVKNLMGKAQFMSKELVDTTKARANSQKVGISATKSETKDGLIRSFAVNSWLHNLESMSVIYGDIALYNMKKEEFHKRNAGAGSTGTLFASDIEMLQYVNNKGRLYARKNGLTEKEIAMDGSYDSAMLADNEIPSSYYEEYYEAIKEHIFDKNKQKLADGKVTKEELEERALSAVAGYKGGMVEGDGQGWITFDFYRAASILEGKWSIEQDKMYNDIINGIDIDHEKALEFFPTRKFQYWGPVKTEADEMPLMGFHKFSLMPLIPSVIKGTNLQKLHDKMVNQEIDYAMFKSGSKVSTITKISSDGKAIQDKFYSDDKAHTFEEAGTFTKNTVYFKFLKDQLEIAPHFKEKVTFPTQMRKLIENGLMEGGVPTDFEMNLPLNERETAWNLLSDDQKLKTSPYYALVKDYEDDIRALTELRQKELEDEVGITRDDKGEMVRVNGVIPFNDKLKEFIIGELNRQDLGEHEISFIKDGPSGTLAHDLSLSLSAEKLEKILNSIVVKRLVKQKFKGEGLIQVSGAGFESSALRGTLTAEEQAKYGTNSLPFYHQQVLERDANGKAIKWGKTNAMKVKIALQGDFVNLLNLKHKDEQVIGTRERLNEMLKDEEWLNLGDNRKMISIIGPRIPVQGLNSMEFAEVYEFLPVEAGNIVVLPSEIVAKAGSDFDIDKLTFMMPNIKVNKDKDGVINGVRYSTSKTSASGLENRIIDKMRTILELKENFVDFIRPNGTEIVKEGLADQLADDVMEFKPKTVEYTDKGEKKMRIPGSRVFEIQYNLYKHTSNNIGKQTLGLGAVDNTYNSIFNRIGARLNHDYTVKTRNGKEIINRRLDILLPHNTLKDVYGRDVISLSHLSDTNGEHKISDVISQLINGWVDIAKDAWIFNLQGNKEISPTLLFMVQAGVPIKQAVYMVANPMIRAYVTEQKLAKSTFAGPLDKSAENPLFYRNKAREVILTDPTYGINMNPNDLRSIAKSAPALNDETLALTGENGSELEFFNHEKVEQNLRDRITAYKKEGSAFEFTDADRAVFLHFLELEDIAKSLTAIKTKTNFDTTKSNTLFEAQNKMETFEELRQDGKFPEEILDKILKESPIGSFYVQEFQLDLWKDLFKLRNNNNVNAFILSKMKDANFMDTVDNTWGNKEKFITQLRNDLVPFMFQNGLRGFNLESMDNYKGVALNENYKVENVVSLKHGVYVKNINGDRVFFVDKTQLKKDYTLLNQKKGLQANTMTLPSGEEVKLATLNSAAFPTASAYYSFVFERELLRSMYAGKDGLTVLMDRADVKSKLEEYTRDLKLSKPEIETLVYEETLRDMALDNTNNNWKLFNSRESMADQLTQIQVLYPELAQNYLLLNNIAASISDKGGNVNRVANIMLTDIMLDSDKINVFHENLKELADPTKIKLTNVTAKEKERVTQFFDKLATFAFLQAGMNTTGIFSLVRIVPQEKITALMSTYSANFVNNMNPLTLQRYYKKFVEISANKSTRSRFRNYTINEYNPAADKALLTKRNASGQLLYNTMEKINGLISSGTPTERLTTDNSGNKIYFAKEGLTAEGKNITTLTQSEANILVESNPKVAFVMNGTTGPIGGANKGEAALINSRAKFGNVIPLPTRNSFGISATSKISDNGSINPELKVQIDAAIQSMIDFKNQGYELAFPATGFGQYMIGVNEETGELNPNITPIARATFVYLSQQLYDNFKYVNPNFVEALYKQTKIDVTQLEAPVTDAEIADALSFCF